MDPIGDGCASAQIRLGLLNPLTLFEPIERYIQQVKRVTASEFVGIDEKVAKIQEAGQVLLRETDEHYKTFTEQLEERRKELKTILYPPTPSIPEELQRAVTQMSALVEKFALRERLVRTWHAVSADEIVRAYEQALAMEEALLVEIFEAYAEEVLKLKGDERALTAFRQRREQARESRVSPAQLEAREELGEIHRLEKAMELLRSAIASIVFTPSPN